jgi:hypothetical protein
MKIETGD